MSNMEDFEKGVALILTKLLDGFPSRLVIKASQLDPGGSPEQIHNYAETLEFLAREGFIVYFSKQSQNYSGVALTGKGLAILNAVPESIREKVPLGSRIASALKDGSKETLKIVVHETVSAIAKHAIPGSTA